MQQLFDSFMDYKDGRPYKFKQAPVQLEAWAENKAVKLENELLGKDFQEV